MSDSFVFDFCVTAAFVIGGLIGAGMMRSYLLFKIKMKMMGCQIIKVRGGEN